MRLRGLHIILFFFCCNFAFSQINLTSGSVSYTQDFNTLASSGAANTWTNNSTITGWYSNQTAYRADDGSTNTGALYSYGTTAASERALGGLTSGTSGTVNFGARIKNNDPTLSINAITISYTGEQWRQTANSQNLVFEYQVGATAITTGTWTAVSALNFATINIGTAGALNGNLAANKTAITSSFTLTVAAGQEVWIRWTKTGTTSPGIAVDDLSLTADYSTTNSNDYFRSRITGNWNTLATWESSINNITWIAATAIPTSAATAVTITTAQTVTINTNATAPNLTINGTLIFDATARTLAVTDYVTISSTGIFKSHTAGAAATHSCSIGGNLTNNNIFDMATSATRLCNVTFNKNGSQSVSGTGGTTRFNYIIVNMGTSSSNILDISTSVFVAATSFLHLSAATNANSLLNGTIKLSGTFSFTGTFFKVGHFYNIPATAGIWINNPNVTITGQGDSYDISGLLKITSGIFNAGSTSGNSILLYDGSSMVVQGGIVNVKARLAAVDTLGVDQGNVTYNQSAGIVNLTTFGQNLSPNIADFYLPLPTDNLIMSGGTIFFTNEAKFADDIDNFATTTITDGLIQIASASTTVSTAAGFYIYSPSPLPSLYIYPFSALTKVVLVADLTIIGDITIGTNTTLDNFYPIATAYYNDISLTGNWNNSGAFIHTNQKTVTFNGSAAQTISGTTTTGFNNLTINNSSGGVTLSSPAIINGAVGILTLTNGFLYTSATNTFTMNTGTSTTGANNNSFVYGPMSKIGNTDFIFPVGKDLEYRPISATSLSGSETFTAEYFHADPNAVPYDVTLKDPTLDDIGRCEYWILNRAGSANANVTLSWDTYSCGVTSLSDLSVARWDSGLGMWKDEGNTATTGAADPSAGTVTSGLVTSFSPFTLASKVSGVNPLPIELLSFTATYNNVSAVDIKWATASELNNDYFTVERSGDGTNYKEINVIDGAGNSSAIINYSTADDAPLEGVSYYRLKQTDFNGSFKYSNIVAVQIDKNGFELLNTFNSLSGNSLEITYSCGTDCVVNFELYDMTGNKVFAASQNASGANSRLVIPTDNLNSGIYLLKVFNGDKIISRKIKL